ncbi:hypothetical protein GOQ27_05830 [Clostridium sp. D2Q-11]|uniref:Uncharacterized protein n=1 Tax=Anaeromonas frigoriresistens TaxID=2683708 RepID=A0A942UW40_9FIRM|nr:hypothetical protein [Anaeromonas frigoriresistens]MBS4537971.1 hypothetical protein [Anaeromonas frigoriresistens]
MLENKINTIINSAAAIDSINNIDYKFRSYEVQLMISAIKSLVPSMDTNRVTINYDRYKKELELLRYYFDEGQKNINISDRSNYWKYEDETFTSRIIPIIISNGDYENAKDEIIKNVLYSTGSIVVLLNSIVLGKLLNILITNKELIEEEILLTLKNEIITFSQVEFLNKYKNEYKISLEEYDGNFLIDFERMRIELINILNGKGSMENNIIKESINIIKNKENTSLLQIQDLYLSAIFGIYCEDINKIEYNDKSFIVKISDYLIKLRKGRINSKNLMVEISNIPDIFKFKVGEVIDHPLLNKCQIINKYKLERSTIIEVMTKSGLYRFKK